MATHSPPGTGLSRLRRADDCGPNWLHVVEDAVIRQDMDWVLDQIDNDREVNEMRADIRHQIERMIWSG